MMMEEVYRYHPEVMIKLQNILFASSMMFYISWMNVGNVNSIIFFYIMLFVALLMPNIVKISKNNLFEIIHSVLWIGFILDQLCWINGDLIEYLKHYNREYMKAIFVIYVGLNSVLWITKSFGTKNQ